jgi:hypothetical protein
VLQADEDGAPQYKPTVVQTTEGSTRLDKQIKRGGVVNLDYDTDLGLNLLLRGHVQRGLFVVLADNQDKNKVFFGFLQPGWAAAYTNKPGATATFSLVTQSAAVAELAKLGIPELTLSKLAKKGMLVLHNAFCCSPSLPTCSAS